MSDPATPRPSTPGGADELPVVSADDGAHAPELSAVLAAAARGDESAWRSLVARYARRVFALARSRVKSPELAEEVTQSVFATVATRLGSGGYTEEGRFESWLFRVTMNRVRDEARRSSRHATPMDPFAMPSPAFDPARNGAAHGAAGGLSLAALRHALHQLPDADREIIELRHHGQMSFKAMADLLSEPLGTLLARHHRALRKLKSLLLDADQDAPKEGAPEKAGHAGDAPSADAARPRGGLPGGGSGKGARS